MAQYTEIENYIENDSILDVVIDPFDERGSKHHIRKIQ
jgi:hypothetical protein